MQKQKTKKYNTKKRKQERLKWQIIIITFLLAAGIIKVHGTIIGTEIALAQDYEQVNIERQQVDNRTIKQHIYDLLIEEGGFTEIQAAEALLIVKNESNFKEEAFNSKSDDIGIWQINYHHHIKNGKVTMKCALDVYCSTRYAIKLHKDWDGWGAWVAAKKLGLAQ